MERHSDRVRRALLDSAEELFARNGVDAISNRRIAEHAGAANHSAVAYHFGTRDELLRALLVRHTEPMEARRAELSAELGPDPTVYDLVRSRILPYVEVLDSLPRPSWRARCLMQLRSVPSAMAMAEDLLNELDADADVAFMRAKTDAVSTDVMRARSGLVGHLVVGVCAEYEAEMNAGTHRGDWIGVGYFLIDAATGMLSAPATRPGNPA